MGKQYNSATDRRWQRRYESIKARKERNFEVDMEKRERKQENRRYNKNLIMSLRIDGLLDSKDIVVCRSGAEVRNVLFAVLQKRPYITTPCNPGDLSPHIKYDPPVALFMEHVEGWLTVYYRIACVELSNNIPADREVVSYHELLPVKDLGMIVSDCSVDELFGMEVIR